MDCAFRLLKFHYTASVFQLTRMALFFTLFLLISFHLAAVTCRWNPGHCHVTIGCGYRCIKAVKAIPWFHIICQLVQGNYSTTFKLILHIVGTIPRRAILAVICIIANLIQVRFWMRFSNFWIRIQKLRFPLWLLYDQVLRLGSDLKIHVCSMAWWWLKMSPGCCAYLRKHRLYAATKQLSQLMSFQRSPLKLPSPLLIVIRLEFPDIKKANPQTLQPSISN